MKKLIGLIMFFLFAGASLNAQNDKESIKKSTKLKENNYCVMLRDDNKLAVRKAGKTIQDNITLANGSVINIDGSVIQKDGSLLLLNIGECVDSSGNRVNIRDFIVIMEAYRM